MTSKTAGRKVGSKNKLTRASKEALFKILKADIEDTGKLFSPISAEERLSNLKHFGKILVAENDDIAEQTRQLIFDGIEWHFKRLRTYFNHLDQAKKASELRQFIKLLGAEEIEKLLTNHIVSK